VSNLINGTGLKPTNMNWKRVTLNLLIVFVGFSACNKTTQPKQKEARIKNYSTYEADWSAIEKMEQKDLGNRVIIKVDSILLEALAEENTAQVFKALAYRSKYSNQIEEESNLKIFNQYEEQIKNSFFPLKQLLHSAAAELYHQYYTNNKWEFQNRTTAQNFDKKDIRTWSLQDILHRVDQHYQQSLTEKEDLLSYTTDNVKDILHLPDAKQSLNQFDGKSLHPTLFDFLGNRALQYYQQNEGRVSTPQEAFQVDNYPIFGSTEQFEKIDFKSTDTSSNSLKTALLFQEILRAHKKDTKKEALLNAELMRLRHYFSTSLKRNKDSLYLDALTVLKQHFIGTDNTAEIQYAIAQFYYDQDYNASLLLDDSTRWNLKKAHKICSTPFEEQSYGAIQCHNLKNQIELKTLKLQTERVYLPQVSIEYVIEAKNIDSLYFKLVRVANTIEGHKKQHETTAQYLKRLAKMESSHLWTKLLANPGDFREHSYGFDLKPLAKGKYLLIASTAINFTNQSATTNYIEFQVSELSFISKNDNKGVVDFYALNRGTGKPIANVKLTKYHFDYSSRKTQLKTVGSYNTDKNGFAKISSTEKERNFNVLLTSSNDTLNNGGSFYSANYFQASQRKIETFLFSDRAIYRPGQTFFFKGIVVDRGRNSTEIKANYSSEVSLKNVNGELVSKLKLKTNDYGSYQGSFTLPNSGLNGKYSIQTEGGIHYFSVEEYKRPTFEVSLDTSKDSQKINQYVTVSGSVIAFSGAKVSEAKVTYRIQRRTSFPSWGSWWRPMPRTADKEIANGEVVADADGKFTLEFFAAADEQVASKWDPNFNFDITIDATSPSGETQSLSENITLGTKEVYLSSNLSNSVQLYELKNFVVHAKNIQGVELNQPVNYTLYSLITPKTFQRKPYWEDAEYSDTKLQVKTGSELHELERGSELLRGIVQSNKKSDIIGDLPTGAYELIATSLGGDKSEFQHRFELYDENSRQLAIPSSFDFTPLHMEGEPGEEASFLIGSSLANLQVLYEIHVDGKQISQQWISLNKEQQKIKVPIKESYRGGIQVSFIGIHNNRKISENRTISVPYTNKKLQLTLGTYRNKVHPGSKEKWTITISGIKGEKLAAELLAGMYDQSLDQFKTQNWNINLYPNNRGANTWRSDGTFSFAGASQYGGERKYGATPQRVFPGLNWFGFAMNRANGLRFIDGPPLKMERNTTYQEEPMMAVESDRMKVSDSEMETDMSSKTKRGKSNQFAINEQSEGKDKTEGNNPTRTNFRETAFFYPQLRTDAAGHVSFEFELPDALTKWKFRALAHTKNLEVGTTETSIKTQKELMVSPTVPRFFREGDQLNLKVLVTNLSEKTQNGIAKIRFFDAVSNKAINIANGSAADQKFNLFSGNNIALEWSIRIPNGIQAIKYQVTANSERFNDGEEKVIPVLPNRKLVTESLPLAVRGNQQKHFVFDKLINTNSKTLKHESFTVEFSTNPAWYAVQALPYVTEPNSECSEQVFARLYATLLAQKIATSNPRIKEVFELWKGLDSKELTSKLMQNQELKSILIEETPWLQQARSEIEQKKRIALLFDFNTMALEKQAALKKLQELQLPKGGWAWYKGMQDNRYISQYILEGFGHLKQLGVDLSVEPGMDKLLKKGLTYLDERIIEDYEWLKKHSKDLSKNHLNPTQIHYLYTRSFFLETGAPEGSIAFDYYLEQAEQYWQERNLYLTGMQALALSRLNPSSKAPKEIVASLRDNSLQTEQSGMYWKENQAGYYWHNAPIETQAMMVEVFHEVAKDRNAVEELRIWLLKEKQTQMWSNSKATLLACYALLIDNVQVLANVSEVLIKVGQHELNQSDKEAGTGYFKQVWTKNEVTPELGLIEVHKASNGIAWGAAYWQYYEDLDKISPADVEEFSVSKTIFKVLVDAHGEKMIPIETSGIEIGDKIRVRLQIESNRNLEFIHVKDMRTSGFEPITAISRYKYQNGLGYYESTKDASTNFFMEKLNKGVFVFEYDLRATVSGEFSNGICTLQCQYAPEFSTHSRGKKLSIKN